MILGALETGGTKMVCAIGDENGNIYEQVKFPTEEPEKTMKNVVRFFKNKEIQALGIASFGPVELNPGKLHYGSILESSKTEWRYFNILESLKVLGVPMELETDVAGSCIGEHEFGAGKGIDNLVYVTIGTGIGAGVMVNGRMIHGMLHPECGHVLINRRNGDNAESACPYHSNCVEGLASGTAIMKHWGLPASELMSKDEVWELEADYIAQALCSYIMTLSPERIILGGGVMHVEKLFPLIRKKTEEYVNGYLAADALKNMDEYIVPAGLGDNQGIAGCLVLATKALRK